MITFQEFESLDDFAAIEALTADPSEERARWMIATLGPALDSLPEEHRTSLLEAAGGWIALAEKLQVTAGHPLPHPLWSIWADRVLDSLLGFSFQETEAKVPHFEGRERADSVASEIGRASWSGSGRLTASTLNTPYAELFRQVAQLGVSAEMKVCDLGCAYGRLGFVLTHLHPGIRFEGFEIVSARVHESKRVAKLHGIDESRIRFHVQDASSQQFQPPECDLYFMYDPFNRETLLKVLKDLEAIASRRPMRILARGKTGELQKLLDKVYWLRVESRPNMGAMPWSVHHSVR